MVKRQSSGWGKPHHLGPQVNNQYWQIYPTVAVNGNLYFSSYDKNCIGRLDIYMCKYEKNLYSKAINLGKAINSVHLDEEAFIAPDESYLIFCSDRHEPKSGNLDLYISFCNPDGQWMKAINMGEPINSKYMDQTPMVSIDGKYLFFTALDPDSNNVGRIFWVSSEVIRAKRADE